MNRVVLPQVRSTRGSRDFSLILASAGLRATAVGLSGVILSLHLVALAYGAASIGLVVSLGLAGSAAGTLGVVLGADRFGRRSTLGILASLMSLGGIALALADAAAVLMGVAFLGMINGMGRDRGAAVTVEQAIIPRTTTDARRTQAFAWYNVVVDTGHAVGALLGGLPALLRSQWAVPMIASYQWTWAVYAVLCASSGLLVTRLTRSVERRRTPVSRPHASTRPLIVKFAALSGLDSLGGGFLTTALLTYWFFVRFGLDEAALGPLFFTVRILNGVSHFGAAWLARRIGLINTMVWTHMPSSVLLMIVPFVPSLPLAIALFLLREALVEMDVPTRQSYIVAVVDESERTRAAGISNLTRSSAWAISPLLGGFLMGTVSLSAPLVVGPGLKIAYDVLLFRAFRRLKPPEERRSL